MDWLTQIKESNVLSQLDDSIRQVIQDNLSKSMESTSSLTTIEEFEQYIEGCIHNFMSQSHRKPELETVAVEFALQLHHQKTKSSFVETMIDLQSNRDIMGQSKPILNSEFYEWIVLHRDIIENLYRESCYLSTKPFKMTYFGWKTISRSYLLKNHDGIRERLEHLFFRVALFLHREQFSKVKTTFQYLMEGNYIHATPTLYHAGLINSQMASCFLMGTNDSVSGIFKTISDCATISKYAGGIGIHVSNIRGEHSYIHGTNGQSNGIMPMLRVYNSTSRYIDQCFHGDTLILCERSVKPISQLIPHVDKVLTSHGYRTVLRLIQHPNITENIVNVKVQTPLGEQEVIMTKHHDLYMSNGEYVSLYDATEGMRTMFMDEPSVVHTRYESSDLFCYGYLYAQQWEFISIKKEDYFYCNLSVLSDFLKKYSIVYELCDEPVNNTCRFKQPSFFEPSDWLLTCDFPEYLYTLPLSDLKLFMDGFQATGITTVEIPFFLRYRLGLLQKENGVLRSMTPIHDVNMTLYDLEIDEYHNYQTVIGLAHNGGGKRKGAFAMYLEPWHNDILSFVKAKRNIGHEEERARDLFYGIWMCDLFMEHVQNDDSWYLFSDHYVQMLQNVYGEEFKQLYSQLVQQNCYSKKIQARELWTEILKSQIETGTPYLLFKDTCNRLSNQQNLGTIKSSNLCCEIIEYSNDKEYAVCNLASISLKTCLKHPDGIDKQDSLFRVYGKPDCFYCALLLSFLKRYQYNYEYYEWDTLTEEDRTKALCVSKTFPMVWCKDEWIGGFQETWTRYLKPSFDFTLFRSIVHQMVENLNIVIDKNYYPLQECKLSNFKHRPIGIGVQGLADVYMEMLIPYESEEAYTLNQQIFEHLYFYALEASCQLARVHGAYPSFQGSPLSKGQFHFDMYNEPTTSISRSLDWDQLRKDIQSYGTRNSLLVAPMPTASTSQILGNTESFEPLTSNYYVRRTSAGEFYVVNPVLKQIMMEMGMWNQPFLDHLLVHQGSIQNMTSLPLFFREVFKTVWEMSTKRLIDMSASRQRFIDQSQSFNLYMSSPDMSTLNKIHFYSWKKQLKTGCYYLRTRPSLSSQHFTLDPSITTIEDKKDICEACSA